MTSLPQMQKTQPGKGNKPPTNHGKPTGHCSGDGLAAEADTPGTSQVVLEAGDDGVSNDGRRVRVSLFRRLPAPAQRNPTCVRKRKKKKPVVRRLPTSVQETQPCAKHVQTEQPNRINPTYLNRREKIGLFSLDIGTIIQPNRIIYST